jgi:putrescine transport system permease protein
VKRRSLLLLTIVAFGYAFLYVPIISVMIYSFNGSRLVTLWGGFSLRWYQGLLHDDELLSAALLSLRIAAVSATVATGLLRCSGSYGFAGACCCRAWSRRRS